MLLHYYYTVVTLLSHCSYTSCYTNQAQADFKSVCTKHLLLYNLYGTSLHTRFFFFFFFLIFVVIFKIFDFFCFFSFWL
jgi:hypothetical protein